MNKDEAKRLLPYIDAGLVHALAEGRLQYKPHNRQIWYDQAEASFTVDHDHYRIKPLEPEIDASVIPWADWVFYDGAYRCRWIAGVGSRPSFADGSWAGVLMTTHLCMPDFLTQDWKHHDLCDADTLVILK